jgi:hypothetical protein
MGFPDPSIPWFDKRKGVRGIRASGDKEIGD